MPFGSTPVLPFLVLKNNIHHLQMSELANSSLRPQSMIPVTYLSSLILGSSIVTTGEAVDLIID